MRVEVLFPDVANLYGDLQNVRYLLKSIENSGEEPSEDSIESGNKETDVELVLDEMWCEPHFVKGVPDLIYMGSMSESSQVCVVEILLPYRERLARMIEEGVHFLLTGNALEIFGRKILEEDGTEIKCLDLIPTVAKRDMQRRHTTLYVGNLALPRRNTENTENIENIESIEIVGFKSQFSYSYLQEEKTACNVGERRKENGPIEAGEENRECRTENGTDRVSGWLDTKRGEGLNPGISQEGIRTRNFFGTYLLGPLLPLNPLLTKWLLGHMGIPNPRPAFEPEAMEAYRSRQKEYADPKTIFNYAH